MSEYLNQADSDSDENSTSLDLQQLTPEQLESAISSADLLKQEGNSLFSAGDYESAVGKYSSAINTLGTVGKHDSVILANRSAAYLALKRFVPACHDAIKSGEADPTNWKAFWRQGVALMSMAPRKFRTEQAIKAYEICKTCTTLPENKKAEIETALRQAHARLEQQEAETPMPDMSKCAQS